jgi:hypothetical protein
MIFSTFKNFRGVITKILGRGVIFLKIFGQNHKGGPLGKILNFFKNGGGTRPPPVATPLSPITIFIKIFPFFTKFSHFFNKNRNFLSIFSLKTSFPKKFSPEVLGKGDPYVFSKIFGKNTVKRKKCSISHELSNISKKWQLFSVLVL